MNNNINNTKQVKATEIIGKKILSKSNGEVIGQVHDIVYNPTTHKVQYLITQKSGWFSNAKVIPLSKIDIIGEDRVMVPDSYVEISEELLGADLKSLIQEDDIINKLNVITKDGKELGKIVDIYFDRESGVINQFEVSHGLIDQIISGTNTLRVDKIRLVGLDAVIVDPIAEDRFEEENQNQGLKGAVNTIQSSLERGVKNVSETTKDVIDQTKERTSQMTQNVKENISPVIDNVKENIEQNTPDTKNEWVYKANEGISKVKDSVDNATTKVSDAFSKTSNQLKDKLQNEAISRAIGKITNKPVINKDNSAILINRGETITMDIINLARRSDKLEFLLNPINYS